MHHQMTEQSRGAYHTVKRMDGIVVGVPKDRASERWPGFEAKTPELKDGCHIILIPQ